MSDSVDTMVDTTSSRERIKRALSHGKKGRINKDLSNKIMLGVFRAAAYVTTLVLIAIIAYVVINGLPHISLDFIFGWPQGVNAEGGIWPTIVSTVYVTALAMLICAPVAVLAAVYLAEYAKQGKVVELIRYAADALASVPSIVMGLFGYALFVEAMGLGLSMVSAALALALLMLPIVMRTTEEAIRAVPRYIRWGAYGLGATKWQVVSKIVLPSAFGRIATGIVLAIGRAIVRDPAVFLMDEPLSNLDAKLRVSMRTEIRRIQQEVGITAIYVTHDQSEAMALSDSIIIMNKGVVAQIGSPQEIYSHPNSEFVADFIGESNILDGVMLADYKVNFSGHTFDCVDAGFEKRENVDVVIRPEDVDIVSEEKGMLKGIVTSVTFLGVHYEIIVDIGGIKWMIQTTDFVDVDEHIGLYIEPDAIHIMKKSEYSGMYGDYSSFSNEFDELSDAESEIEE